MSKIAAQRFRGTTVKVDGTEFEACSFDDCTLIFHGGDLPQFKGCTFNTVKFMLDGPAARTAAYIRTTFKAGAGQVVRDWLPELFITSTQH